MAQAANYFGNQIVGKPVTIFTGGTKSSVVDLLGYSLVGIIIPAAFTGTALSFETSDAADGTFVPVKSTTSGSALSYTVAQGTYAAIDPKDFAGVRFIKFVSGSTEIADRVIKISMKGI